MPPRIYSRLEIDSLTDKGGFKTLVGRKEYLSRRLRFERGRAWQMAGYSFWEALVSPGIDEFADLFSDVRRALQYFRS